MPHTGSFVIMSSPIYLRLHRFCLGCLLVLHHLASILHHDAIFLHVLFFHHPGIVFHGHIGGLHFFCEGIPPEQNMAASTARTFLILLISFLFCLMMLQNQSGDLDFIHPRLPPIYYARQIDITPPPGQKNRPPPISPARR